jgi:Asp-tRNA(Asn)/Glu-tRNA(Gln) amidotransferase A subunit family amidase
MNPGHDEICLLSVQQLTRMFTDRTLSPVELMQATIARSESWEPRINAFSHTFFDQALQQARASEARYQRGAPLGVLDGIPVAIKDEADVEGQPNTEGSLIYRQRVADEDAVFVARLRQQGAIFHARTTCPEFCSLWNTQSRLHGVTRNPWNTAITPGGSSGGSGASLAAGTSILASGSDIGGSIRFPASMCGLVGYKPPFGRVPENYVPYNLESYCANGPMARTVADTALMQNIISGQHPGDAASTLPRVELPLSCADNLAGQRIAFSMDFGYMALETDVVRNTRTALLALEDLGAEVVEVDLGWPDGIERAYYGHMDPLFFAALEAHLEQDRELLCDYNVMMAEQGRTRQREDPLAFYHATVIEAQMYQRFAATMEGFDAFVCPTVTSNRLVAEFNPAKEDYVVAGVVQDYDLALSTCHLFNMMGRCPSLSVPSGLGDNGVPTGLMISSTAYDDAAVFRVAAALEGKEPITYPQVPPG